MKPEERLKELATAIANATINCPADGPVKCSLLQAMQAYDHALACTYLNSDAEKFNVLCRLAEAALDRMELFRKRSHTNA